MSTDSSAVGFWKEREDEKGGKIRFNTFATFIGRSGEKKVDLGGLVYLIDNLVYFENFAKDNAFLKILTKTKEFQKTEFSFSVHGIKSVKEVSQGEAANCINGVVPDTETKPVTSFLRFFANPVLQVQMEGGYSYFFDIMKRKEFIEIVRP